jgi:hypothetical protein
MNVFIDKTLANLGKSLASLMANKIAQSKFGRDLKERWVTDNYHTKTVQIFTAAVNDARYANKIPDELFCDLISDSDNRDEVFRWILEGVRPGHFDKRKLNVEAYMEENHRYQDQIYPFFETILSRLEHYKKTYWSPEFLEILNQIEELKTVNYIGFQSLTDMQTMMAVKQDRMYEWIQDSSESTYKYKYTQEWFGNRVRENMRNIGQRYSEDLNLELKASEIIDAMEWNEKFRFSIVEKCNSISASIMLRCSDESIVESLKLIEDVKREITLSKDLDECLQELANMITLLKNYLDTNPHTFGTGLLRKEVSDFYTSYIDSNLFQIARNPFVLISGEAGVGKSHFMADQVSKRLYADKLSIFLLGQLFHSEDTILSQIRKQLDIASDETMEDVFKAFNDYGEEKNERVIIFIDALNEGRGKRYWLNSIGGFIEGLRKYSNIALVMSIRDTYESQIIPEGFYEINKVNKVEFEGFDNTDQAILKFFNYYKVPMNLNDYLKYEFRNPLFLKVYCMSYDRKAATGTESIEGIFNNYFKRINQKLQARIENYPKHGNLVIEALGCYIDSKLKHKGDQVYFFYEVAARDVNQAMAYHGLGVNFFDELINEKIIAVNSITYHGEEKEIVYIAFELFEEFITAKKIVDVNKVATYTSSNDLESFFSHQNPYFHLLSDKFSNRGVFQSLTVQIPDAVDIKYTEQFEMFNWPKHILKYREIDFIAAYYNSLTWRRPERINGITHSFILNKTLFMSYTEPNRMYEFWDVVLKFTVVKNHFYNADYLYKQLIVLKLDEFNAFWTVYVSKFFDENESFKRIMSWASKDHINHSQLNDESIRLLGMNITWFTASTCSRVRDVSIKVMVALFTDRIDVLLEIIKKFRRVEDAYVLEALFCAAYGCVMSTRCMDHVKTLAEYIYEEFFDEKEVIPHAMIRNYMTGILGFALYKGLCSNIHVDEIKPPFKNRYCYYEVKQDEIIALRKKPSAAAIHSLDPHYAYRSRDDLDVDGAFSYQREIIVNLESSYNNVPIQQREKIDFELTEIIDQILPQFRENFVRMVIKEIFSMGYNFVKFGEFDYDTNHSDNNSLGQKYEWIALNKILAIYLDSKQYIGGRFSDDPIVKFKGVWQLLFFRKIDPSIDYFSPFDTRNYKYNKDIVLEELLNNFSGYAEKKLNQIDWISVNNIRYHYNNNFYGCSPLLLNNSELEAFKFYIQGLDRPNGRNFEDLYAKEIYWSEAYKSLLKEKIDMEGHEFSQNKVTDIYCWDINDGAMDNYIEFSIVSPLMFTELKLSIGSSVFELLDEHDEIASLQLYEQNYEDLLLIRRDLLVRYLIRSDKVIAWPFINGEDTKIITFDGLKFHNA